MNALFYTAAAVAIAGTALAVTGRHAVHALLCLLVGLLGVATAIFALGAPYAAALQVILYAGAIMMLFLFVIIMIRFDDEAERQERAWHPWTRWAVPAVLGLVLMGEWVMVFLQEPPSRLGQGAVSAAEVGSALLGSYLLGVELVSIILLASLIGAYHLARERKHSGREDETS